MAKFCAVLRKYPKDVPGGAEYQAYLICRELAQRGHQSHYVAHRSETTNTETDDEITVHRMGKETDTIDTLEDIQADFYYFRLAQDLPILWHAKRQINAQFVYNISRDIQCQPLFAPGPYHDSNGPLARNIVRGRYAIYRYLLRSADELFVQSRQQQTAIEANHSLESTVIGNGHPIPKDNFQKGSPPVVLWLASLKRVKNPEIFVNLVEAASDLPCQFWIVGRPVDDEIEAMIDEKTSEYGNLTYHGGCGILESNKFFRKASVYVHTGDSEGFPNTFIQSWLHKVPVLSFWSDPDSVLETDATGDRCHSMDEAEANLRKLINDDSYREKIGANAREYGIKNHSIESIVDRVERQLGI